jgi:Pvc16 N-terminal domain
VQRGTASDIGDKSLASHAGTLAVLQALKSRLESRMRALLGNPVTVNILGSGQLASAPAPATNALAIYLHRISIDPVGRNRYLPPAEGRRTARPELPVNLHLLLIGWNTTTDLEVGYLTAAMQVIGSTLVLGAADVGAADPGWGVDETVQVLPEDMSTEDLMRLWDSLPGDYRLSAPYLVKTLRLAPDQDVPDGPLVRTLVFPSGTTHGDEGDA